ncbi:MAG: response regulator transcription factor [Verrucomicrobia bacterium]|nr:response regulator transcription factor [Verrucomicrobiota bacterium]
MSSIRVTLTEDDAEFADVFERSIVSESDLELTGCFGSGEEMLTGLPAAPPTVALVDLVLPGLGGAECIRQLAESFPQTSFVVLTGYRDDERLFGSLRAGAAGYVLKSAKLSPVFEAVRLAAEGGAPMSPGIARRVVRHFQTQTSRPEPGMNELSRRENEVLAALAQGQRYKEIAASHQLSEHTVRTYIRRIYFKLSVTSRSEAVAKFLRQ